MTKDQVLRAGGRSNRIGLNETHAFYRGLQRRGLEERF
jgi:hypothetical protein